MDGMSGGVGPGRPYGGPGERVISELRRQPEKRTTRSGPIGGR